MSEAVNVNGITTVLEARKKRKITKFIFGDSSGV